MLREPLKARARGRWFAILEAVGVPAKALKNKHGPCPVCGGKDRFRFDDKDGTGSFYCSKCGPGDGIELVKRLRQLPFKDAAVLIETHLGEAPIRGPASTQGARLGLIASRKTEIDMLWSRTKEISENDAAGRYLRSRTGMSVFPSVLRFAADERYAEAGTKPSWHPAMVALVEPSDAARKDGEQNALHRTYLDGFGGKAEVQSPRKMLGAMPAGAAVRLMPHVDVLGIAEGIETALSASKLFGVPVWASLTAGLLQEWSPPAAVRTVVVFADSDPSFTGQAAAFTLAKRLEARGLTVQVKVPATVGKDWNDVLVERSSS